MNLSTLLLRFGRNIALAGPVLLALVICSASPAHARFDPDWRWSAIETEHFVVYHHDGFRETALRAAAIAEDAHSRLVPAIGWEPSARTHLVLADASDAPNGYTSPFPYNRIVLYLTPPLELPGFGLAARDEWLRLVITHEYAHTLSLDMVSGLPAALRSVFGRLYFPNLFQPIWLIEGLATYTETEQTAGGRGRSSYEAMVLRMAALSGSFPSLGRMAVSPEQWPSGSTPYLFGESFTRFLAGRYGKEAVAGLTRDYAGRAIPLRVNAAARRAYGKGYGELYREWRAQLVADAEREAAHIRSLGETASRPLTRRGHLTLGPAWSPDGSRIAFLSSTPDETPGLYVMQADGGGVRRLADAPFAASASGALPAWSRDGRLLYYTRLEIAGTASLHSDIYCVEVTSGRVHRVTQGMRARDPEPTPDGSSLVFAVGRGGGAGLVIAPLTDGGTALAGDPAPLTPEEDVRLWALPRFAPDGAMLAASAMTPDGETSIEILDPSGRSLGSIPGEGRLVGSPAWNPDSEAVIFSSDRDGTFDLFAVRVRGMVRQRVTRVVGGAFAPAPSPDGGSLAFVAYGGNGFDIHLMPLDPSAWPVEGEAGVEAPPTAAPVEAPAVEARETSPFAPSTLLPRYWLPTWGWDEANGTLIGISTSSSDPLERHAWAATVLVSPETGRVPWAAAYAYDGLTPTIGLTAYDRERIHGGYLGRWVDPDGENDYAERERSVAVEASLPFPRVTRIHQVSLAARYRRLDAVTDLAAIAPAWGAPEQPRPEPPAEGEIVSGVLSYAYAGYDRPPASIAPEGGRTLRLAWEHADAALGGDLTFDRATLDWREYLRMPWRHQVLSLRLSGGTTGGDRMPQRSFLIGGESVGDLLLGTDDDELPLRGYPAGLFAGQNALLVGAEYRFPIVTIERGAATAPFYLRRLHASVFAEAGDAWDGGETVRLKTGVGATVALDMTLFWGAPVTLRLVAAKGLDDGSEDQVYFTVAMPL